MGSYIKTPPPPPGTLLSRIDDILFTVYMWVCGVLGLGIAFGIPYAFNLWVKVNYGR